MKRDRIYRVEYEERWQGSTDWGKGDIDVLANGSIDKAISAAKKHVMSQSFVDDGDDGDGKTHRPTGFRALSVNVLATADIEG